MQKLVRIVVNQSRCLNLKKKPDLFQPFLG